MKKQTILSFLLLFLAASVSADAQQIHQLSQYSLNDFVFNPAIAGKSHDLITKLNYRKQWAGGFDGDAPSTFSISGHTNLATDSKAVGVGMTIFSDVTGPTRRGGATLNYAYHLPFTKGNDRHLSFGLASTFMRQTVDFDKLTAFEVGDNALTQGQQSKMNVDFNFGAYFYEENYFIGLSIAQLLGTGVELTEFAATNDLKTVQNARHFYLSAGYRYDINEDFAIEPIVLMKYANPAPAQFDLTARVLYQKQYFVGLTYRTQDALAVMLGVALNNGVNLAYSYDFTLSEINKVSNGTHEITLGYDLKWNSKRTKKERNERRNRVKSFEELEN